MMERRIYSDFSMHVQVIVRLESVVVNESVKYF